jgi:hypothetical protein
MCHYLVFKDQVRLPNWQSDQHVKDALYNFFSALLSTPFLILQSIILIFLLVIDDRMIDQGKQYI